TKFGFRIKAGSKLSFQIHVPEGTAGQKDSSQLRVYFYPIGETGIREMYFETILQNWNFQIPANTVSKVIQRYPPSSAGLQSDFSLFGAFPHSHNTCTSILNYAYKGADTIALIRINKWDFHWQMQYTFKSLLKIPAGYRFYASHVFDNTINNPYTPDPSKPVLAGLNTTDEMLFDSYLFAYYRSGDENVNIDSLIKTDPLFISTGLNQLPIAEPRLIVYPNPFSNFIEIENRKGNETFSLFNSTGQLTWKGLHIEKENFNELTEGLYILQIKTPNGEQFLRLMKN
ncbi:MAG: T9SS type A sorting domain-containing protein, partial [bacterium]|nr:T9SS type A sorting domain-containing protein [bacterium]